MSIPIEDTEMDVEEERRLDEGKEEQEKTVGQQRTSSRQLTPWMCIHSKQDGFEVQTDFRT